MAKRKKTTPRRAETVLPATPVITVTQLPTPDPWTHERSQAVTALARAAEANAKAIEAIATMTTASDERIGISVRDSSNLSVSNCTVNSVP